MLSAIYSSKKRDDAFTLIELLIVVIIIGILAAIALPIFINQQRVAVDASVQSDVRNTVTNITNAQAQKASSFTAAVSGADTKVALTAVPAGSAAGTAASTVTATKDARDLTNIPDLGGSYTVDGWNAGGLKFLGTAASPAFEFTSATGRFTQGNGAAPSSGSSTGGGSSAGAADPGVGDDSGYSGALTDFSFNSYKGIFTSNAPGNSVNGSIIQLSGGWFSSDASPTTEGPAFLHDLTAYNLDGTGTSHYSDGFTPSDVRFFTKSGTKLAARDSSGTNCQVSSYDFHGSLLAASGFPGFNTGSVQSTLRCGIDTGRIGAADAADLRGGHVTFTDPKGAVNTVQISAPITYTPTLADQPVNPVIASTPQSGNIVKYGFNFRYTHSADTNGNEDSQNLGTAGIATQSSVPFFDNVTPTSGDNGDGYKRVFAQGGDVKFFDASGTDVTDTVAPASSPLESCSVSVSNSPDGSGYYSTGASVVCYWVSGSGDGIPMSAADFRTLLTGGHIEVSGVSIPLGNLAG